MSRRIFDDQPCCTVCPEHGRLYFRLTGPAPPEVRCEVCRKYRPYEVLDVSDERYWELWLEARRGAGIE